MRGSLSAAWLLLRPVVATASHNTRAINPIPGGWPYTPFTTSGRDILDSRGEEVVYAGVNWPGAAETMLPEGLQYNSIANITAMIKSLGMNTIRLTYATEMVDDFLEDSPNQTLQNTLIHALGQINGTRVLQQILHHNPDLTTETTRLQVFDHVALACAEQEIYVHLDNHVSKAQWCCSPFDGNSWFGDTYFDVGQWIRGHGFMANRVKYWTAIASMALRNELRPAYQQPPAPTLETVNWTVWYDNMVSAAKAISGNNSKPLIFFGGINGDTNLMAIAKGQDLGEFTWQPSSFAFERKIVYELHHYETGTAKTSCTDIESYLYLTGYGAMNMSNPLFPNKAPMVMTEYGFDMTDGSYLTIEPQCIPSWTEHQPGGPGGLMQWVVAGSYYIRQGVQDADEPWGFLSHDWQTYRNETVVQDYIRPWVKATVA